MIVNPKAIITASSGIEVDRLIAYKPLVDEAISLRNINLKCCCINRKLGAKIPFKNMDIDYDALIYGSEDELRSCKCNSSTLCLVHLRNNRKTLKELLDTEDM